MNTTNIINYTLKNDVKMTFYVINVSVILYI